MTQDTGQEAASEAAREATQDDGQDQRLDENLEPLYMLCPWRTKFRPMYMIIGRIISEQEYTFNNSQRLGLSYKSYWCETLTLIFHQIDPLIAVNHSLLVNGSQNSLRQNLTSSINSCVGPTISK